MINIINKTVGYIVNPLAIALLLGAVGALLVIRARKRGVPPSRLAVVCTVLSLAWMWFWAMPITGNWLALPLEEDYPVILAEDMPSADAIVLMGGGCWGSTNYPYAKPVGGSERIFHAARLWKAGKAPVIIPSCVDAELADVKVLKDLGVPDDAVKVENDAVNTEENAKFVRRLLHEKQDASNAVKSESSQPRILLVTSAIHMRRSVYMFEKYAPDIEVIPAATDYCALPWKDQPSDFRGVIPTINSFSAVNSYIHEYIGYWGYKLFR